jgi:hypothetical protein
MSRPARAAYGLSPGDESHDEPYLSVSGYARDGLRAPTNWA